MREALAIVAEQGLDAMWHHHTLMGKVDIATIENPNCAWYSNARADEQTNV